VWPTCANFERDGAINGPALQREGRARRRREEQPRPVACGCRGA
jgi:hypothetical protein